jgi:RNA-directed DNA polymerase
MKWEKYKIELIEEAKKVGNTEKTIGKLLIYAKKLFDKGLPIIFDATHLSLLVGYDVDYLVSAAARPDKFYRVFLINKRNGQPRTISEPLPSLKEIQRWILDEILSKVLVSKFAKGYVIKKSIKDNARFHKNQKLILCLDIKDFFPSINFGKVYSIFKSLGYSKNVSALLGNICCLEDGLPQGAPTSPTISNIVMRRIDSRIGSFCVSKSIMYTRYADDLTFSGDFDAGMIIKFVNKVIFEDGFRLNYKKIKTKRRHQAQIVTGVVTNEKIQATRKVRRGLRQDIYYINRFGLSNHMDRQKIYKANYVKHLLGVATNILFLNQNDRDAIMAVDILKKYLTISEEY